MSRIYSLPIYRSPIDVRDYIAESIFPSTNSLPSVLDLRGSMLPPRDQGAQGSCGAMAASAMKEWQERKDINFTQYMSPQFIYNNRENIASEGMNTRDLMKILQKVGSIPEILYPYNTSLPITEALKQAASKYKVKSYAQVTTIQGLKTALNKSGPCLIAVPVYNYGNRMWKATTGATLIGGHALTVCGYTRQGFILRNSWGSTWNTNGYTIFPYEDFGSQWEIWTTVDENSGLPVTTRGNSILTRILRWIR